MGLRPARDVRRLQVVEHQNAGNSSVLRAVRILPDRVFGSRRISTVVESFFATLKVECIREVEPPLQTLRYEPLVADPATQSPALLQAAGLDAHPDCLARPDGAIGRPQPLTGKGEGIGASFVEESSQKKSAPARIAWEGALER